MDTKVNTKVIEEYKRLTKDNNSYYSSLSYEQLTKCLSWELEALTKGFDRLDRVLQANYQSRRENASKYGATLRTNKIHVVAQNLAIRCEALKTQGTGRRSVGFSFLSEIDPYLASAYGLEVVVSSLTRSRSVPSVAMAIGNRIEQGILAQALSEEAPKLWVKVQKQVRRGNINRQGQVLKHILRKAATGHYGERNATDLLKAMVEEREGMNPTVSILPNDTKMHVGLALLEIIVKTTGIAEIQHRGMSSPDVLCPTTEVLEWIKGYNNQLALLSPVWCPLPIPPKDWTTPWDGGYHSTWMPKYTLVNKANHNFLSEFHETGDLSKVYTAVNAAQRTGWRINKKLLDVALVLWESEAKVNALPDSPDVPIPVCPVCGLQPTAEERKNSTHPCFINNPEALSAWRDATRRVYDQRVSNTSRCIETAYTLEMAKKLRDEPVFYFPYYLDFRGRLYCRVSYLTPQGGGLGKSLLEFAEGKPIGTQAGADWLAIHVANSFGHDKLSFEERIAWTKENTEMIMSIADNPLDNLEHWANLSQKEAWCALASAFDWAGYMREGLSYVSHLPIAQDGTCSGLQHYSALLRDEHTAKQVNVAPTERPADVYAAVAEATKRRLEALIGDPEQGEMAMAWLETGIVNRKLTKRAVMTLPYGSTLFTCKDYVADRYLEAVREQGKIGPWETVAEQIQACHWLGNHVWKAIGDVLTVAPIAMGILQKTAKLMAKQGLPLNWTTPSGFGVQQASVSCVSRRLRLALSGDVVYSTVDGKKTRKVLNASLPKEFRVSIREETDVLDEAKQASGVAPNFIHSLDASALVLTVNKMVAEGYKSFALIHDSFAVHACDSARLASALREAFVEMYTQHDPFKELFNGFRHMLTAIGADKAAIKKLNDLESQLPYGTFDLNKVKESKYFFA